MAKTVTLELVGLDGNAFSILGAFQRQARKEGWTAAEIKEVIDEAKKDDYNHLLSTIMDHCESPESEDDDDSWDDEDDGDGDWEEDEYNDEDDLGLEDVEDDDETN